jgi:hypothetical protein
VSLFPLSFPVGKLSNSRCRGASTVTAFDVFLDVVRPELTISLINFWEVKQTPRVPGVVLFNLVDRGHCLILSSTCHTMSCTYALNHGSSFL